MSNKLLVTSAYSVPLNGEAPSQIMFFPAGKHTIKASVNGAPKKISVSVTKETANVMQTSLSQLLSEPIEPFIDYDHKGEAAAAIPKSFTWKDGDGVMLDLEWTAGGASAVQGKAYRYFSPTFHVTEDGIPCSLPDSGPVGSLVNNPAFRRMKSLQTISASDEGALTGDDTDNNKTKDSMDSKIITKLVSLGLITAEDASDPDKVTAALEANQRKGSENKELVAAQARIKALETQAEEQRVQAVNREADLLIEGAVKAHKIEPKNEKAKAGLKKFYLVDAEGAKEYVESLPVNAAFGQMIKTKVGDKDIKPPGVSRAKEIDTIVMEIQASHPGMTYSDAFDLAEKKHPDIFGTSVVRA